MKETTLAVCVVKSVSTFPSSSPFTSLSEGDNLDTSDNLEGKVVRRFDMVDRAAGGVLTEIMLSRSTRQPNSLAATSQHQSAKASF